MSICVDVWVKYLFLLLVDYDVNFTSTDDKVCERNFVGDFIVLIPSNNRIFNYAPVDAAAYEPYCIMIA